MDEDNDEDDDDEKDDGDDDDDFVEVKSWSFCMLPEKLMAAFETSGSQSLNGLPFLLT